MRESDDFRETQIMEKCPKGVGLGVAYILFAHEVALGVDMRVWGRGQQTEREGGWVGYRRGVSSYSKAIGGDKPSPLH